MNSPLMHEELVDFFAMHEHATTAHKAAAFTQINVALDISHAGQRHIMELEQALRRALTAPHDHAIDHNLNYLRTRIRSAADAYAALVRAAEDVAARLVELEDGFSESTRGINNLAALRSVVREPPAGPGDPPDA
jgi:hypothetical protein